MKNYFLFKCQCHFFFFCIATTNSSLFFFFIARPRKIFRLPIMAILVWQCQRMNSEFWICLFSFFRWSGRIHWGCEYASQCFNNSKLPKTPSEKPENATEKAFLNVIMAIKWSYNCRQIIIGWSLDDDRMAFLLWTTIVCTNLC